MKQKESSQCQRRCLAIADCALCLFVFFPLAILHWRGTWELQDVYFFPAHDRFLDSNWLSLAIGSNLGIIILLLQPSVGQSLDFEKKVSSAILSRAFMYLSGWAVMCYWRGLWNLLDIYLTDGWVNSLILMVLAQVVCIVTFTLRTVVGIPVSIFLDTDQDILDVDTVFKVDPSNTVRYIADCLFSQFIVISCNVILWRGMWNILDTFLFPDNHLLSDLVCLAIGYGIVIFLFVIQAPSSFVSVSLQRYSGWKIVFEDFIFLIIQWGNLCMWRGAWDLCVHYFLPGGKLGPWISHWMGTLGLMGLQVFNTVALNGVERDGQYPDGEGLYPTKYLRVYLKDVKVHTSGAKYDILNDEESAADADVSNLSDADYSDSSTKLLISSKELAGHSFPLKSVTNGIHENGAASYDNPEVNDNRFLSNGNILMEEEQGIS